VMDDVLVVGAGPVGLTMAAELARHRTRCRIIDRLAQPLPYCRAIGVTPRTLEVWEDMGIAREMIDAGLWIDGLRSIIHGHAPKDNLLERDELPYGELGLPQYETERLLARHLSQFGIEVERSVTLAALDQRERDVQVRLDRADGTAETATFRAVVGCDGAHSAVRRALGIPFEGEAFPIMFMLGDVHIDWDLPRGMALRALRLVENAAPDMFIVARKELYRQFFMHGDVVEVAKRILELFQAIHETLKASVPRNVDVSVMWGGFSAFQRARRAGPLVRNPEIFGQRG